MSKRKKVSFNFFLVLFIEILALALLTIGKINEEERKNQNVHTTYQLEKNP